MLDQSKFDLAKYRLEKAKKFVDEAQRYILSLSNE